MNNLLHMQNLSPLKTNKTEHTTNQKRKDRLRNLKLFIKRTTGRTISSQSGLESHFIL